MTQFFSAPPPEQTAPARVLPAVAAPAEGGRTLLSNSPEDLIIWPCGIWCHRFELSDFSHKSDDYEVIQAGTLAALYFENDPSLWSHS